MIHDTFVSWNNELYAIRLQYKQKGADQMKVRLLTVFILVVGLALVLTWAVGAQGPELLICTSQQRWKIISTASAPSATSGSALVGLYVQEVVVSPAFETDGTLLASTPSGLYKSTNGGQNWTLVRTSGYAPAFSPGYATDRTIYVADMEGAPNYYGQIFKSTDRGNTWTEVYNMGFYYGANDLVISPNYTNDGTIYAPWMGGDNLLYSTDWGASWRWRSPFGNGMGIFTAAFSPAYASDRTIFLGGYKSGVKRSTDDGATWQWARAGMETASVEVLAVSPVYAADHTLFAGTRTDSTGGQIPGLFKSTTSGDSWVRLRERDVQAIALSPDYASEAFVYAVGGYWGLMISPDGGNSFVYASQLLGLGPHYQYPTSVAVTPDGTRLFVGTNNGLYWMPAKGVWSSTITPGSGGTVRGDTISTTVSFTPGAITDTVTITLTAQLPGYTSNLQDIGHFFDVTAVYSGTGQPAQLAPGQTYTLTAQYNDAEKGPAIESTLALYYWDSNQWMWIKEPTSVVDVNANTVTATPNHFSVWAVLGETRRVFLPVILKNR
jgi:hypothetical protein